MPRVSLTLSIAFVLSLLTSSATNAQQAGSQEGNAQEGTSDLEASSRQLYEVRSYLLGEQGDAQLIDDYLSEAFIPAMKRQGIGPIGAFTNAQTDQSGSQRIVVVIPYENAQQIVTSKQALQSDQQYQQAAKPYLDRGPSEAPYGRIQSELLVAIDSMPKLTLPSGVLQNDDRVYELRLYESANERLGNLKVDMFNSGEVPIFLDSGIQPIFIGQGVIGAQLPSLTYLTVYPNDQARVKAWDAFRQHPDWQVLKEVPKYQGTVSGIDQFVLTPKPYSQM